MEWCIYTGTTPTFERLLHVYFCEVLINGCTWLLPSSWVCLFVLD
jgi:hypothetical protein